MLPNELDLLLNLDVPTGSTLSDTYLNIIQETNREITISRVYGYYLNVLNDKGIAKIFFHSLSDLIFEKKGIRLNMGNYKCKLEERTKSGKRIDIYLHSEKDKEAIVIENKIFHGVNNDLLDYWQHVEYPDDTKIGVLLTLRPAANSIPPNVIGKFINITHVEWLNKTIQKGLLSNLSANQYIYLTDFIKNMTQLSQSNGFDDQARFFFDHTSKIVKAIETEKAARRYVNSQLAIVADWLGWYLSDGDDNYQTIWDYKSKAYYTIILSDLFTRDHKISIILELYDKALAKDRALQEFLKDDMDYDKLGKDGLREKYYIHFAYKSLNLGSNDLANLGEFLVEQIKQHFRPVMTKVLDYLQHNL